MSPPCVPRRRRARPPALVRSVATTLGSGLIYDRHVTAMLPPSASAPRRLTALVSGRVAPRCYCCCMLLLLPLCCCCCCMLLLHVAATAATACCCCCCGCCCFCCLRCRCRCRCRCMPSRAAPRRRRFEPQNQRRPRFAGRPTSTEMAAWGDGGASSSPRAAVVGAAGRRRLRKADGQTGGALDAG